MADSVRECLVRSMALWGAESGNGVCPTCPTVAFARRTGISRTVVPESATAGQPAVAPVAFLVWKHSRQNTGRPCVGRKGTVVSRPHCEQMAEVSTRPGGTPRSEGLFCLFTLHALQRFGSFLKSFS